MTYGSCHRMWLSNVQTYSNPYVSARLARSTTRADGGVVCNTTPNFMPALPAESSSWASSVLREPEVDRAGGGVGPAARDDLAAGVEVDPFRPVHVRVAEEARLPAAEAVVAHRHRDRHVDAHHADVDVELELAGGAAVAGEDRRAVAERVVVDEGQALLVAGHPLHAEHWSEDLVVVGGRARLDVVEQRRLEEEPIAGHVVAAVHHHRGAVVAGRVDVAAHLVAVLARDQWAHLVVRLRPGTDLDRRDALGDLGHQLIGHRLVGEHHADRHAP